MKYRNTFVLMFLLFPLCLFALDNGDFFIRPEVVLGGFPPVPNQVLQYDDGSPCWLTWQGAYRGVLFYPYDFVLEYETFFIEKVEFWFYHHVEHPWDTSSFFCELWSGDEIGPADRLDQCQAVAMHFAPVNVNIEPLIWFNTTFWIALDVSSSTGGWPSILCDGSGNVSGEPRSYFSDDFIVWEPWYPGIECGRPQAVEGTTWGSLKAVF